MSSIVKQLADRIIPDPILFRVYPKMIGYYSGGMTWYTCGRHFDSPIDPFHLIQIDPTNVSHRVTSSGRVQFEKSDVVSEVLDGDWHNEVMSLDEYDLTDSLRAHFDNEVRWEDTEFYERMKAHYREDKGKKWGCQSFEEFIDRLHELDQLYEVIDRYGYRTQRELRQSNADHPAMRRIHRYWPPELLEVTVNVGPEGELLLHDGRHRLTIAQCLDLDKIPVRVKTRHLEWQLKRDQYSTESDESTKYSHPDLKGLNGDPA